MQNGNPSGMNLSEQLLVLWEQIIKNLKNVQMFTAVLTYRNEFVAYVKTWDLWEKNYGNAQVARETNLCKSRGCIGEKDGIHKTWFPTRPF